MWKICWSRMDNKLTVNSVILKMTWIWALRSASQSWGGWRGWSWMWILNWGRWPVYELAPAKEAGEDGHEWWILKWGRWPGYELHGHPAEEAREDGYEWWILNWERWPGYELRGHPAEEAGEDGHEWWILNWGRWPGYELRGHPAEEAGEDSHEEEGGHGGQEHHQLVTLRIFCI